MLGANEGIVSVAGDVVGVAGATTGAGLPVAMRVGTPVAVVVATGRDASGTGFD